MNIRLKIIYFIVFFTGLFSLVYQTIWQRYLTYLVGADALSSTLTLTVFLTALSLGYYLAARYAEKVKGKELKFYGFIEFFIGVWALLFPWLFAACIKFVASGMIKNFMGDVILTVILTAIPAILMGFTLPFLTQGLAQNFQSSSRTHALIYATNTLGACIGALLTGFYLVEHLGLANTMYLAAFLNIVCAVVMIIFKQPIQILGHFPTNKSTSCQIIKVNKFGLLFVVACSGYLLIAIESYFIRYFSLVTDGSIYAYPTVVTAFIAAIGIGAWLASSVIHQVEKFFPYIPLVVMFLWLAIYLSLPQWPFVDLQLKKWLVEAFGNFHLLPLLRFCVLFLIIGLPIIIASMVLPFSFHLFKKENIYLAHTTGNLYAVATLATLFGGFFGGYFLFNYFDYKSIFINYFLVMASMAVVTFALFKSSVKHYLILISSVFLIFITLIVVPLKDFNKNTALSFYFQVPTANQSLPKNANEARSWLWNWFGYTEIIASSMRAEGQVNVFNRLNDDQNEVRMIAINGRSNSSTDGTDYQGNALLSLFPYLMTESPKKVLVVGLGTGVTAGAIASQKLVERVDVCEINAAVIEQFPLFDFATFNASNNSKVQIIQSDVIKYLLRTDETYDVIVSIPSNFWTAGIENLMTTDFYQLAENKLAQGGTFIQWIPDYDFSEIGLLTLVNSFTSAFNNTSMWRLTSDDLVLMFNKTSSNTKLWLNNRLRENVFLDVMDAINYSNPSQLKLAQIAKDEQLRKMAKKGLIHNINNPHLGHLALEALYHLDSEYSAEKIIYKVVNQ